MNALEEAYETLTVSELSPGVALVTLNRPTRATR